MRFFRLAFLLAHLTTGIVVFGQSIAKPAVSSDAQTSFALLQSLSGTWRGFITSDNPAWSSDKPMSLSIRHASHGNALIHELDTGGPEVTVFYMENGHLDLVHYCDLGNRPHMTARPLRNGQTIEFNLTDFSGSDQVGHVSQGVFTIKDSNHHVEDWTFLPAGSKPVHVHMDFERVQ